MVKMNANQQGRLWIMFKTFLAKWGTYRSKSFRGWLVPRLLRACFERVWTASDVHSPHLHTCRSDIEKYAKLHTRMQSAGRRRRQSNMDLRAVNARREPGRVGHSNQSAPYWIDWSVHEQHNRKDWQELNGCHWLLLKLVIKAKWYHLVNFSFQLSWILF